MWNYMQFSFCLESDEKWVMSQEFFMYFQVGSCVHLYTVVIVYCLIDIMSLYVCKQTFRLSKIGISKKLKVVYILIFIKLINILIKFQICISVPLK